MEGSFIGPIRMQTGGFVFEFLPNTGKLCALLCLDMPSFFAAYILATAHKKVHQQHALVDDPGPGICRAEDDKG